MTKSIAALASASASAARAPLRRRPPFPSGWACLPLTPADLTLANTLPVGQSFLWHQRALSRNGSMASSSGSRSATPATASSPPAAPPPLDAPVEEFSRAVDNPPRVVCLRQTASGIYYAAVYPDNHSTTNSSVSWEQDKAQGTTKRWLEDYFALSHDLPSLYDSWRTRDARFFGHVELGGGAVGVRVLRQDPWECLVAFITSANNNISRITSLLHKLSERFSPDLLVLADPAAESESEPISEVESDSDGGETTYRLFPPPHAICTDNLESVLRELGFGYRANYLASTLAVLLEHGDVEAELHRWRSLPLPEVRERLLALKGVGRKVADCVMLMCMDQPSLIPIDTHIYNIATRHPNLPSRLRKPKFASNMYDDLQAFLADAWGPMGGWCQAVVFAAEIERRKSGGAVKREVKVEVKVQEVVEVAKMAKQGKKAKGLAESRAEMEETTITTRTATMAPHGQGAQEVKVEATLKRELEDTVAHTRPKRTRSRTSVR